MEIEPFHQHILVSAPFIPSTAFFLLRFRMYMNSSLHSEVALYSEPLIVTKSITSGYLTGAHSDDYGEKTGINEVTTTWHRVIALKPSSLI